MLDAIANAPRDRDTRWDLVGVVLLVALSFTDLAFASAGGTPVTAFLVVAPVCALLFVDRWTHGIQWCRVPVIAGWMAASTLINWGDAKLVSVAYSGVFLVAYVMMMNTQRFVTRELFAAALKLIIIAFFVNVLASQLLELAGAPRSFLAAIFHRATDPREDVGLRYYGFSSEPSYAAFIVIACFACLRRLAPTSERRMLLRYGALVAYQLVAFQSVYGYLLGLALAVAELRRSLSRRTFVWVVALGAAAMLARDVQQEGRFTHLVEAAMEEDVEGIADLHVIDSSLFLRTAPAIEYVTESHITSPSFFVGHGAMTSTAKYTEMFAGWIGEDDSFMAALLPGYFFDYGLIGGVLVLVLIVGQARYRIASIQNVILVAVLFNASFNTQLFWFVVGTLAMTNRYAAETVEPKAIA